jgi:hypothetical protein
MWTYLLKTLGADDLEIIDIPQIQVLIFYKNDHCGPYRNYSANDVCLESLR